VPGWSLKEETHEIDDGVPKKSVDQVLSLEEVEKKDRLASLTVTDSI